MDLRPHFFELDAFNPIDLVPMFVSSCKWFSLVTVESEAFRRLNRRRSSAWLMSLFCLLFFFSGATSLIYQSWVWSLSLFFGSDVYSATITLAVFMGGLALGSWLASRFVDTLTSPIAIYGLFEIGIGLAALAVPSVLDWFHRVPTGPSTTSISRARPGSTTYSGWSSQHRRSSFPRP